MTKHTAQEVRECIARRNLLGTWIKDDPLLIAYADLLEQMERAVPVPAKVKMDRYAIKVEKTGSHWVAVLQKSEQGEWVKFVDL